MQRVTKKIKRVKPLILVREAQLSNETGILNEIRSKKFEAMSALRENQRLYLDGLAVLNTERNSGRSGRLLTLESSLDVAKDRWFEALRKFRRLEEEEKVQVVQVMAAHRNVNALENLKERYIEQQLRASNAEEQKQLDSIGIQNHQQEKK